jgi:hypothetical protein
MKLDSIFTNIQTRIEIEPFTKSLYLIYYQGSKTFMKLDLEKQDLYIDSDLWNYNSIYEPYEKKQEFFRDYMRDKYHLVLGRIYPRVKLSERLIG